MSCVFLTFFFDYEIKAGHKFISLTMKADFEKKYQGVIWYIFLDVLHLVVLGP